MFTKILKIFLLIVIISLLIIPLANKCSAQSSNIWDFGTDKADIQQALSHMQDGTVNKDDVGKLITGLADFLLFFVTFIGVIFLIVGGYQYITSAGNPDQIQKAKNTIMYSIIGIAMAGLASAIVTFARESITGPTDIQGLVIKIINQILIFVIGLAVLFIIVGGYQYITSTGNPDQIQKAKSTITAAISGLIIAILSRAIATFAYSQVSGQPLTGLLKQLIDTALGVISTIAVLFLIIGGYQYMTSAGNPDQIQKAKNTILYSVIGLAVAILSFAIVRFVAGALGVNI